MAKITWFSVEKNISSSKQLIGLTKYRFSLHQKINIIISEQDWVSPLLSSPLLSPHYTSDCRVVGAQWLAVVSWLRDEKESRWGWERRGPPPPSHNQLLILSGGSEWLTITTQHSPSHTSQLHLTTQSPPFISHSPGLHSASTSRIIPVEFLEKGREQDQLF